MTYYHYTGLAHLPDILRDGLTRGEIAKNQFHQADEAQAVSLTTQADPGRMHLWGVGSERYRFKLAVRLVTDVRPDDPLLSPALVEWGKAGVPAAFVRKHLNPHGEAKWWAFYHGPILPARFAVELRGRDGYFRPAPDHLARVVAKVEADMARHEWFVPPGRPWARALRPLDPEYRNPGILFEEHPADM